MSKRLLFIGVIVLVVSSAASAGTWDWLWGFIVGGSGQHSQGQITYVTAGNGVANQGVGTTSNTNGGTFAKTQTSPSGTATQSSSVTVMQNSTVTGYSPNSSGVAASTANVVTFQYQQY